MILSIGNLDGEGEKQLIPLNIEFTLYSPIKSIPIAKFTSLDATNAASVEDPQTLKESHGFNEWPHKLLFASIKGI